MATYLILNFVFLAVVLALIVLFLKIPKLNKRVWIFTTLILLTLTVIFDSLIIKLNIVAYDSSKISGIFLGKAPIEDFFYTLLAILLIPALWKFFDKDKTQGIRKRTLSLASKLKKLFWVSRPVSWLNTAYPFAAGYLVINRDLSATLIVGSIFFLVPYNLLMYGINDVFDYESDILNPRKGGIEGMKEQRKFHPTIIKASVLSCLPFVIFLFTKGDFRSNLTLSLVIFMVIAYSAKYLRFKEIPVLDSITSSAHFVGPLVYALILSGFNNSALPFIIAFFLWGMASHAFGAVQDILPDRSAKISSIATYFGARRTVSLSILLYSISALILVLQNNASSLIVALTTLLYILNIFRFRNVSDKDSEKTNMAWRRFIWLNMFSGFVVTLVLIFNAI